jgi:hypothetical protein
MLGRREISPSPDELRFLPFRRLLAKPSSFAKFESLILNSSQGKALFL